MDEEMDDALERISKTDTSELPDQIDREISRYWNNAVSSRADTRKGLAKRIRYLISRIKRTSNLDKSDSSTSVERNNDE